MQEIKYQNPLFCKVLLSLYLIILEIRHLQKKISDTLTSYGRKISSPTIESYLQALEDSFIVKKVNRYEVSGKQILKTQNKYYVTDLGLQKVLLSNSKSNYGHKLENIVYLELLRRNYKNNLEVDFVAEKMVLQSTIKYHKRLWMKKY